MSFAQMRNNKDKQAPVPMGTQTSSAAAARNVKNSMGTYKDNPKSTFTTPQHSLPVASQHPFSPCAEIYVSKLAQTYVPGKLVKSNEHLFPVFPTTTSASLIYPDHIVASVLRCREEVEVMITTTKGACHGQGM